MSVYFPKLTREKHVTHDEGIESGLEPDTNQPDDHAETDQDDHPDSQPKDRLNVVDSDGKRVHIDQPSSVDPDHDSDDDVHIDGTSADRARVTTHTPRPSAPEPADHSSDRVKPTSKAGKGRASRKRTRHPRRKASVKGLRPKDPNLTLVDDDLHVQAMSYGLDTEGEKELEELEAKLMAQHNIVTDGYHTFRTLVKKLNKVYNHIPHNLHDTYRLWLLTKPVRNGETQLFVEDLPRSLCDSRTPIREGLTLYYPSGPHWIRLVSDKSYHKKQWDRVHPDDVEEEQSYQAMRAYRRALECSWSVPMFAMAATALVSEQVTLGSFEDAINSICSSDIEDMGLANYVAYKARKIKKRSSISTVDDPEPSTIIEALLGERGNEWVTSIFKEFNGLMKQGVFSHGWTKDDLVRQGITSKPVPCSIALTHKMKEGRLEKLKTRICIAGHRGNVTKGIHYNEVFSPSPVQHTEKLLQAMMVNLHLENIAYDVKMAYTWAPLPPGERIAVLYPEGFKSRNDKGEELYMILEKNLYGMPSAGRGWQKHRDAFILDAFNKGPWSCIQSVHDPCLFVIDKCTTQQVKASRSGESPKLMGQQPPDTGSGEADDLPEGVERSWVLIHTDDCDAYGTSLKVLEEIESIMDDKWEVERVDRSYVLGVKRNLVRDDPNGWSCTLTMTTFIDDLAKTFERELTDMFGRRNVSTPFTENLILTKSNPIPDDEIKRNIDRGYQRLVGSLLWCVRHVSPICMYGCSQLCKLMSSPSDEAWGEALHMLKYLHQNKDRGVKFTETDLEPIAFVDASNKDDPVDGKTQYGYQLCWGGPLITKSGKLNHVGINSTYNEYMALHHCVKQTVWVRQLMSEIGLSSYISRPTKVYADNMQANNLCKEDMVTAGNMYFRTGYHYNKEAVRDGFVDVEYIHTSHNIADATTKGLGSTKIKLFEPLMHGHTPLTDLPLSL